MANGKRRNEPKEPEASKATPLALDTEKRQPARPYARIQLTVEPGSFVLQPYRDRASSASNTDSYAGSSHRHTTELVRILFKAAESEPSENEYKGAAGPEKLGISFSGLSEGQAVGRVSFLSPGSYIRSAHARDYIIYGCVGLLDLYTGPHFIVITSVKALGDIEDKPVYAINKVAVLPLEAQESRQVLDRLAQWIDPFGEPIVHEEQVSGQSSRLQTTTITTTAPEEGNAGKDEQESPSTPLSKSPKVRFSFLGARPDKGLQKSLSNPSLPLEPVYDNEVPAISGKKISFDAPRLVGTVAAKSHNNGTSTPKSSTSQPVSPTLSPTSRSTHSGFFAKLRDSLLDAKSPRSNLDVTTPQPSALGSETSSVTNVECALAPMDPSNAGATMEEHTEKEITDLSDKDKDEDEDVEAREALEAREEEEEKNRLLDRRVIREISSVFGTGFYFSTEFDLLSSMQTRYDLTKDGSLDGVPLWKQVDKRFWWNEHLMKEFLDIEADGYILPVMQGYVEIEPCEIEEQHFEFTLISRRSRERSGLRYQRRGIDENGNTANFVETEQLLRIVRDDSDHQVSFVQTRGSIPLFWSQSPYRLKPIPIMERTEEENETGFKKHVDAQIDRYGRQIFINLVEQHGRELVAGSAYTRYVEKLAEPRVTYVEFDFHEQCKGMKYENIERLIKSQEGPVLELGYCWLAPRNTNPGQKKDESFERLYEQKGVIRTNCMDCLDRTNVVQSAIGRYILNHQLLRLGIASFPDKGLSVYEDFENVFNHVWANNGDAISREYAGTSALKGDFTRTGKRNLQGMINDATNSMARMYQNTFKDYFRQAAIDYLLGAADKNVFKNLQTTAFGTVVVPTPVLPPPSPSPTPSIPHVNTSASAPELPALIVSGEPAVAEATKSEGLLPSLIPHPSVSLVSLPSESAKASSVLESLEEKTLQQEAWVKIREAAIETSAEIVISPGEERWKGWTFICCSNEISSALTSISSPQSSPLQQQSKGAAAARRTKSSILTSLLDNSNGQTSSMDRGPSSSSVFYDEKIVLLTEKALYICTYDYEMEKVLEFWRLALEKMTGIDKGAYFLTAQDKSQQGQDLLENYGFAVLYRASSQGETMRVNSGSVRNRRKMGLAATASQRMMTDLDRVPEMEEENQDHDDDCSAAPQGQHAFSDLDDARTSDSLLREEKQQVVRSVRFKIVKHPETSIVPFVTSSTSSSAYPDVASPGQSKKKANPSGYKRTAQDCVEWVVTEIVQARCELISVAEGAAGKDQGLLTLPAEQHQQGHPGRSPSEEYNYQPPPNEQQQQQRQGRPSVQVDLVIRDRVLQSLETASQLETASLKEQEEKTKKQQQKKKIFADFFSSSKSSKEKELLESQQSFSGVEIISSNNNSKSWLKRFQFGQDSETDSDDDDDVVYQQRQRPTETQASVPVEVLDRASETHSRVPTITPDSPAVNVGRRSRSSSLSVFAKLRQAVKNL
ncbi:hypothetical protein BGX28_009969 [Mortierella sp. GBA30]|nr:hypothetical protein BGX28_009969 [Mortierella sp. GBA30]